MARLPNPGSDTGVWGEVLNDFLSQSHDSTGLLKPGSVGSATLVDGAVTNAKLDAATQTTLSEVAGKYTKPGSGIPAGDLSAAVQAELSNAGSAVQSVNSQLPDGSGAVTIGESDIANLTTDLAARVTTTAGGGETYFDAGSSGAATTLNLANGNVQKLTLTANCTLSLTSPAAGTMRSLTLLVFQDATGARTVTWPAVVKWGNAGAPVLTTAASRMDIVSLFTVDGGTNWYGALGAKGY